MTIVQAPNLALWVFLAATAIRAVASPSGWSGTAFEVTATVAIMWWAVAEVAFGVNPWRRALGATVLAVTSVRLLVG